MDATRSPTTAQTSTHSGNPLDVADTRSHSLLIVDNEAIVCEAVKALLTTIGIYQVAGVATSCDDALSKLDTLRPRIMITEINLPGKSGVELIREARSRNVCSCCIALTSCRTPAVVQQALEYGAISYILKSDSVDGLLAGLSAAVNGKSYTSAALGEIAISRSTSRSTSGSARDPLNSLSPREREIFYFLANGMQNSEIARTLFISPRTVETHRARVVRKLGLKSNAEIIRYAIRSGLVTL